MLKMWYQCRDARTNCGVEIGAKIYRPSSNRGAPALWSQDWCGNRSTFVETKGVYFEIFVEMCSSCPHYCQTSLNNLLLSNRYQTSTTIYYTIYCLLSTICRIVAAPKSEHPESRHRANVSTAGTVYRLPALSPPPTRVSAWTYTRRQWGISV